MLTKHQQQDLEKAILGYLVSKKYYQTVSSFAQESPTLQSSDFISLTKSTNESPSLSQINLIFNISQEDSNFALAKNSSLSDLSVISTIFLIYSFIFSSFAYLMN
jgi:hypothetical protein